MQVLLACLLLFGFQSVSPQVLQRGQGHCECGSWWTYVRRIQDIPRDAVEGGIDIYYGGPVYIGRIFYNNELIPGKVVPKIEKFYFPYNGKELDVTTNYEVLSSSAPVRWQKATSGVLPRKAVLGGHAEDSTLDYYICRVFYGNQYIPGKIKANEFNCYYPVYGREQKSSNYEVLVVE